MSSKIKTVLAIGLVITLTFGWLNPVASRAATGIIYLAPATASVEVNSALTLALRINPGTSVNAVQATVNYNASDLSYQSDSLGAFPTCTVNNGGGGTINLACAMLASSTSSDSLIANLNFVAIAGSGSTNLSITNANAANNGSYTNPSVSGATVSFSSPAPAPAPSHSPAPTNYQYTPSYPVNSGTATVSQAAAPPPPPPTPVKISVEKLSINYVTASFTVVTSAPAQLFIAYGTSPTNLSQSTSLTSLGTKLTLSLTSAGLLPGTTYYYQLVARDAGGNMTKGAVQSLTTKGLTVKITVLGAGNQPLPRLKVTLHSKPETTTTNAQGVATFTNVAPGIHQLIAGQFSTSLYVGNNVTVHGQYETSKPELTAALLPITVTSPPGRSSLFVLIIASAAILLCLVIYYLTPLKRRLKLPGRTKLLSHPSWHWTSSPPPAGKKSK